MKAMILVVSPKEYCSLLNGDLSLLVRKKFPKDYVGWVYIYCTKAEQTLFPSIADDDHEKTYYELLGKEEKYAFVFDKLNGKVVARFQITNSELEIEYVCVEALANGCGGYEYQYYGGSTGIDVREKSCLDEFDLTQYLGIGKEGIPLGHAIHITNLEIFDEPKEINEFYHHFTQKKCERPFSNNNIEIDDKTGGLRQPTKYGYEYVYSLTRAPRNGWCYVEV